MPGDCDPRVTFAEWLDQSPFDDIEDLMFSDEWMDAVTDHPGEGDILITDIRGVEHDRQPERDVTRLADKGFEVMPVHSGEVRLPVDGEVVLAVPEGAEPVAFGWRNAQQIDTSVRRLQEGTSDV